MSSLWMSIEPELGETRLMLTQAQVGTALRARLPTRAPSAREVLKVRRPSSCATR